MIRLFKPDMVLNLVLIEEAYTNLVDGRQFKIKTYLAREVMENDG
jgi:hypothetical protein